MLKKPDNIIKLSQEGLLVKCKAEFSAFKVGAPKNILRISPKKSIMHDKMVEFSKNDLLMYLGCRVYPVDYKISFESKFDINYTASLRFLVNENICKMDFFGNNKLNCLQNASFFMHEHFSLSI